MFSDVIQFLANIAAIVTGVVAGIAGGRYLYLARQRRLRLEQYLEQEKGKDGRSGAGLRTVIHLMASLHMTEAEILHAAFSSKKVKTVPGTNKGSSLAVRLFFQSTNPNPPPWRPGKARF